MGKAVQIGFIKSHVQTLEDISDMLKSPQKENLGYLLALSKKYKRSLSTVTEFYKEHGKKAEEELKKADHRGELKAIWNRKPKKVKFPVEVRESQYNADKYYTIAHAQDGRSVGWVRFRQDGNNLFIHTIQKSAHSLPTKLRGETDNWPEEAIALAEEEAAKHGVKKVVINSPHGAIEGSQILGIHPATLKHFYYDTPKKMGYELQYLPEKNGFYWVKELA